MYVCIFAGLGDVFDTRGIYLFATTQTGLYRETHARAYQSQLFILACMTISI